MSSPGLNGGRQKNLEQSDRLAGSRVAPDNTPLRLRAQVVLMEGYQGSLRWDWQFFSQSYFGLLGAPRREDWKQDGIIRRMEEEAGVRHSDLSLALIPDLPRFNTSNFMLAAAAAKKP